MEKKFWEKSLTMPKKIERGAFGIFLYPVCRKTQKKLKGGTLWSRPALYVMRETFWFCSLGQQVKFEIL